MCFDVFCAFCAPWMVRNFTTGGPGPALPDSGTRLHDKVEAGGPVSHAGRLPSWDRMQHHATQGSSLYVEHRWASQFSKWQSATTDHWTSLKCCWPFFMLQNSNITIRTDTVVWELKTCNNIMSSRLTNLLNHRKLLMPWSAETFGDFGRLDRVHVRLHMACCMLRFDSCYVQVICLLFCHLAQFTSFSADAWRWHSLSRLTTNPAFTSVVKSISCISSYQLHPTLCHSLHVACKQAYFSPLLS